MMIIKLFGCLMVLLSSGFLGFVLSADCGRRPRQLRELQSLLQLFENQISYMSDVLTQALGAAAGMTESVTGRFFSDAAKKLESGRSLSASEAWEEAVKENIGHTSLNSEDGDILLYFGRLLGSSDLDGQIKNIRLALNQLKLQEQKAEESRRKNEAMFRSLGILGGLAVVIVLI